MSKFQALVNCAKEYNEMDEYSRAELIELYYKYTPRDCADLIDTAKELKRINTIELSQLKNEVQFYMNSFGW